ncbi:hypothetical protein ACQ9BO_25630 [Flavobacterium sp. P21]|uniref:hypothetical protein n=1 Tax=Flavobacterium sp. P21 TaxID=3423948 RepID=UPI003D664366
MKKIAILVTTVCATALTYISCSGGDDIANQTDTTAVGASISIDAANEMDVNTGLSVTNSSTTSKPAAAGLRNNYRFRRNLS